MENLHISRTTYQLIERAVEALECIGRELERYNDRHERDDERIAGAAQTSQIATNSSDEGRVSCLRK